MPPPHDRGPAPGAGNDPALASLSPPVRKWFESRFEAPTEPQRFGWPSIARGEDTLIAAPTGSGKTLAAFLGILDRLVRQGAQGGLADRVEAVYVSPLRALSYDIQRNLERPLQEIRELASAAGEAVPEIRVAVRTGDTPPAERQAALRRPPHILVTTPESLFLLLTSERSRALLSTVRTVIVDEIHALAGNRRGAHLSLSLERLDALCESIPVRIGLSATQNPVELLARFLVGAGRTLPDGRPACTLVDLGHQRDLDLAVEVPVQEGLQAVAPREHWDEILDRIALLVQERRTTLVFVNTRRLAERLAHRLEERLGSHQVAAHHGSLSRERRLRIEELLRSGKLRALVATASLELGIDIGSVELVCQIGSPRSIATFLQRVGRSGHSLGLRPRGRLFPTTRDELVECAALVRAVRAGRLDRISVPKAPIDVLAQQIVAECAAREQGVSELYARVRRSFPYRDLDLETYEAVLEMLARGFETPRGRRGVYLHRDRVHERLRARRGARLAALTSGGAIADTGQYSVVLEPEGTVIGSVDEDFAVESLAGDIFLLGTHSWRIRRIENGIVRVIDAEGAPPNVPFWVGEAPARTAELSDEVSALRAELAEALDREPEAVPARLQAECGLTPEGAEQLVSYIRAQQEATGVVPTREEILVERFFDEAGGMQLILHAPVGARINRGLGLALRKRLCRSFNMELQAAATDDAIVLSLGTPQTFPLEAILRFVRTGTAEDLLTQAFLASPMFTARWRWNATRSLAVLRSRGGRRVPFALQRMQSDDLLGSVFPDQVACQENVTGPIEIPDHPLVRQTVWDCLHEAADLPGLLSLLERIESGEVRVQLRDTVEPSPFAHEILNARPYAFLDDAPLEERRTRAVALRHVLPDRATDLARLDPEAVARVREEANPRPRDADELHELLFDWVVARSGDLGPAEEHFDELLAQKRAFRVEGLDAVERLGVVERRADVEVLFPESRFCPDVVLPRDLAGEAQDAESVAELTVRGHLATSGPIVERALAARIGIPGPAVAAALARLEAQGVAVRGRFDPELEGEQVCDRALLARIHRYTIVRLRRDTRPVEVGSFARFLLRWQHVHPDERATGEGGTLQVVEQLAGFEAAAGTWESDLLPDRVDGYRPELLDRLCLSGQVAWGRLVPPVLEPGARPSRATPIAIFPREKMEGLLRAAAPSGTPELRGPARRILELLETRGALFLSEIVAGTGLLPVQVEEGLRELVAVGMLTADGFGSLRRLLDGRRRSRRPGRGTLGRGVAGRSSPEGRWGLLRSPAVEVEPDAMAEEVAWRLLGRYGVVFRDLIAREFLPGPWRDVHRALRRLEARGLVRGGRFVTGFVGEQFALPDAIPLLRRAPKEESAEVEIRISACDPLNLAGILTPGARVPASPDRRLLLRNGLPAAVVERGRRTELAAPFSGGESRVTSRRRPRS
jgi:ATP-dependent Lhr-like helicase